MASTADKTRAAAHSELGHVVPLPLLAGVFLLLLILTGVTVGASYVDLGNMNLYVALAIAGVKAALVAAIFMHLAFDRPFNAMLFAGCLLFVMLFIGIALTDSRANHPSTFEEQGAAMRDVHTPLGTAKE